MNKTLLLVLVLMYGVICLIISARGAGKVKVTTGEGFFMGARSLGLIVSVTSITMGVLSGLAMFGSPALVMRSGNITLCTAGFGVMGLVYPWYGYKLWKMGKERHYLTTADFMKDRYSVGYSKLVAVAQLVFMIPYLTVQFVAIGNGLSYFCNISYTAVIVIFAILLIAMLWIGGAGGVGYMDVFNCALGFIVPLAIVIMVWVKNGGAALGEMAMQNDAFYLDVTGGAGFGKTLLNVFTFWFSAFFAIMFSPHVLGKMMMVKDRATFRKMTILAPLTHILVCIPIFANGWIGIALYKPMLTEAGNTDFLVQTIMQDYAPAIFVMFMLWALLAFAMSTANAFTISCSTVIAHDLVTPLFRKQGMSEEEIDRKSVTVGKISVIVIVVLAAVLAMGRSMFITDYAYSLATPGFAQVIPAVLFGLFWKRGSKQAAATGTIAGLITLVITTFVIPKPFGIHQIIWSVGINIILYMLVTFFTKPEKKTVEAFFSIEE